MPEFEKSIAHEAHALVHGDRAKTYGHPRFDFSAIGKVWTGLLQDLLKEDAAIDPYRVSVLMSGLKLCRLVKSPDHRDSRIDTIGYMLTMERLDEPEDTRPKSMLQPVSFSGDDLDDDLDDDEPIAGVTGVRTQPTFSQVNVWFEAGETKVINGNTVTNPEDTARTLCFPLLPDTYLITVGKPPAPEDEYYDQTLPFQPLGQAQGDWVKDPTGRFWCFEDGKYHRLAPVGMVPSGWQEPRCPAHGKEKCAACSQNPDPGRCQCGYFENTGMHWDTCPGRIRTFPAHLPRNAETKIHEVHGGDKDCWCGFASSKTLPPKREVLDFTPRFTHDHENPKPCMPGCPVFDAAREKNAQVVNDLYQTHKFEFTGEQVDVQRRPSTPWDRSD